MYRRHGQKLAFVFLLADLAVTAVAWLAASALALSLPSSWWRSTELQRLFEPLPYVLVLAAVAYRLAGLYEIHRLRQLPRELGFVIRASVLLFLLIGVTVFYRRDPHASRAVLALFVPISIVALVASRRLIWITLKALRRRGLNHGHAIVVGAGRTGRRVARALAEHRWTGLEAIGFVDDPSEHAPTLLPRLGCLAELPEVLSRYDVDHVFVALPLARYHQLPQVYDALTGRLVDVQLVPDVPQLAGLRVRAFEVDQLAFLSLREDPLAGYRRYLKRAFDVALSSMALLLLAPLLSAIAVAVRLTSAGPALYRQTRVGRDGRAFELLKFRSMPVDAESRTGPVWSHRGDTRSTWLGRLLRRWNLDELPQLWNVLRGDMSLVGPRPERRVFVDRFCQALPSYGWRHRVPAGLTGWAQVHGWRGNTSLRRRLEHDLYYVNHWSLALDLKILVLTLWRGFNSRHAY